MTQIRWGGKWVHLAYIWIVCHLSAKNYQNRWKFDAVLKKQICLVFLGHGVLFLPSVLRSRESLKIIITRFTTHVMSFTV